MTNDEDTSRALINGKYFPSPIDAPDIDTRLIDIVRRVIFEQRPYKFKYFDMGNSFDDLMRFFKDRPQESELVQISCEKNQVSGTVTVIPICLVDREDSISQIE